MKWNIKTVLWAIAKSPWTLVTHVIGVDPQPIIQAIRRTFRLTHYLLLIAGILFIWLEWHYAHRTYELACNSDNVCAFMEGVDSLTVRSFTLTHYLGNDVPILKDKVNELKSQVVKLIVRQSKEPAPKNEVKGPKDQSEKLTVKPNSLFLSVNMAKKLKDKNGNQAAKPNNKPPHKKKAEQSKDIKEKLARTLGKEMLLAIGVETLIMQVGKLGDMPEKVLSFKRELEGLEAQSSKLAGRPDGIYKVSATQRLQLGALLDQVGNLVSKLNVTRITNDVETVIEEVEELGLAGVSTLISGVSRLNDQVTELADVPDLVSMLIGGVNELRLQVGASLSQVKASRLGSVSALKNDVSALQKQADMIQSQVKALTGSPDGVSTLMSEVKVLQQQLNDHDKALVEFLKKSSGEPIGAQQN